MGYYISIFSFLLILSFWYDILGHKCGSRYCYWVSCFILIIFSGIRYRVGGDTLGYFDSYKDFPAFQEFANTDFSTLPYEFLFYVFPACAKLISPEFYVFQFLHAIIVNTIIFWFIKKHTPYKFITITLYFILIYLYFNMEIMRESLSICVFLLATDFLLNKKFFKYYILSLIAVAIHISAFILFTVPILYLICTKSMKYCIFIAIGIVLIYQCLLINISNLIGILPLHMLTKLIKYANVGAWLTPGSIFLSCAHIFILITIYKIHSKKKSSDMPFLPFMKISIILCICVMIPQIQRLSWYFYMFEIILGVNACGLKIRQLACFRLALAMLTMIGDRIYYYIHDTNEFAAGTHFYELYIPYETIFSPKAHPHRENIYYVGGIIDSERAERNSNHYEL